MVCALHVAVNVTAKSVVKVGVGHGGGGGGFGQLLWVQEEDVGFGVSCNLVEMIEDGRADAIRARLNDETFVNVDSGAALVMSASFGGRNTRGVAVPMTAGTKLRACLDIVGLAQTRRGGTRW